MPKLPISLAVVVGLASVVSAQPARLSFDAASVRLAIVPYGVTVVGDSLSGDAEQIARLKRTGGPGTSDPGRIHYPLISLKALLNLAWEGSYSEIKSPDWLDTRTVAIDATMPRDTSKEQFREMLRSLLTDRFGLKYHVALCANMTETSCMTAISEQGGKENQHGNDERFCSARYRCDGRN